MAAPYQLLPMMSGMGRQMILRVEDNAHIPDDPDNIDYQVYMTWLAEGNEPDPYVVPAPPDEQLEPKENLF